MQAKKNFFSEKKKHELIEKLNTQAEKTLLYITFPSILFYIFSEKRSFAVVFLRSHDIFQ